MNGLDVLTPIAALAVKIRAEHLAVKEAAKFMVNHAMDCGDLLIEAKAKVLHGEWLPWLAKECRDVSERMAQHYMRAARNRAKIESLNPKCISDLTFTEVLRLISEREPTKDDDAYDGPKIVVLNEHRKPPPPPLSSSSSSSQTRKITSVEYVRRPGETIRLTEAPCYTRPPPPPEPSPAELAADTAWNVFRGVDHLRRILADADPKTIAANLKYDDDPHKAQKEALSEAQVCIQWLTDFAEALRQRIAGNVAPAAAPEPEPEARLP